jgi:hypothetical protein
MKERPILFSAPMIKAILERRKRQTRRIIRADHAEGIETDDGEPSGKFSFMHAPDCGGYCDYGCAAAGEVLDGHIGWTPWGSNPRHWGKLWVRETFQIHEVDDVQGDRVFYRADDPLINARWKIAKWKPAIFMPRWASRITLQILNIRVERVQEITEADAQAEGFGGPSGETSIDQFRRLWDVINGKRASWESNPWVWVIGFKTA